LKRGVGKKGVTKQSGKKRHRIHDGGPLGQWGKRKDDRAREKWKEKKNQGAKAATEQKQK
jgi:hypothetical protein